MKILFQCPHCKEPIRANSDTVGDRLQCPSCAELVLVPAQGLGPGSQLAGFRIERQLGAGGMGEVFLAIQVAMDRKVALKVLHPGVTSNKAMVDRFIHEVKMSAKLEHPNIVTAFDAGCADDLYYLAMSFIEGASLEERLREGPLPEKEALAICKEVAKALDYAWSKHRMLHRDIKPANIMVDMSGTIKLMDMGIAKSITEDNSLTMQGSLIGTPYYMSPEQAMDSHDLDCRSDIYSLGASLYHLVTGKVPFTGKNAMSVIAKHMSETMPHPTEHVPHLTQVCCSLICRMMEKNRTNRPQDWQQLLSELRAVQSGQQATAVLGPGSGGSPGDFDSTAGMTVVDAGRIKKAMAARAATKQVTPPEDEDDEASILTLAAPESPLPAQGGGRRKFIVAILSVLLLAVLAGLGYYQFGHRRVAPPPDITGVPDPSDPPVDPVAVLDPEVPADPVETDPPGDPEDPALAGNDAGLGDPVVAPDPLIEDPAIPDDPALVNLDPDPVVKPPVIDPDIQDPAEDLSLRDPGDPRNRVENWESADESPEQKESKELIIALYKQANESVRNRQDWELALATWGSFTEKKLRLEAMMKESPALEEQFKKTLDEEFTRMKHMMVRVGNAYVKTLSEQIAADLDKAEAGPDEIAAAARRLQAFSEFLRRFDLVSDFEAAAVQRWEQLKNMQEEKYTRHHTALEQNARAAIKVIAVANALAEFSENWQKNAAGTLADLTALRRRLDELQQVQSDPDTDRIRRALPERLNQLAAQMQLAAALRVKRRELVEAPRPESFSSQQAQQARLQPLGQLMAQLREAANQLQSPAFIKEETDLLEQAREKLTAIPVEDPWMRHMRAGQAHFEAALKQLRANEVATAEVQRALEQFDAAREAGLLTTMPEANLLSLLPKDLSQEDRKRLLQVAINSNVIIGDYRYLSKEEISAFPESAHIWLRRYPQRVTVLIKLGGRGGGQEQTTAMELALVPPASARGYTSNRPFYIGVHEVSVGDYRRFSSVVLGQSIFSDDSLPLRNARYVDAVRFCNWLSLQSGAVRPGYQCLANDPATSNLDDWKRADGATGLALPTAAEWMVACHYGRDDQQVPASAVYADTVETSRPLKREELARRGVKPNMLGIYAMPGNVAELVTDLAGTLLKREVALGRDFRTRAEEAATQYRQELYPDDDRSNIGFRLVLPIQD